MASVRRSNRPFLILFIALCGAAPAWALASTTLQAYTAHLEGLRSLLTECQADAAACDPGKAGNDDEVDLPGLNAGANVNRFEARYDWLRETIRQAHNPAMKDRGSELAIAMARVDEALAEAKQAGVGSQSAPSQFPRARAHANAILDHTEFMTMSNESIWDRVLAKLYLWLDQLFGNVAKFGKHSPWIGPLLEWGLIVLALTGLVLWAMRAVQRQRLKVRLETTRQIEPWEEASRNWRAQAAEQAGQQEWREAVHCLYWASIVMLEGRRSWTPNRSRTPREYVRLLEAGSPGRSLLGHQTQGFERIWYGLNPAEAADYQNALELHEQLRTA
jgi:hypothetical protein